MPRTPLLAAKFFLPNLSPKRVIRARLTRRLTEGLAAGHPLTLISAPAGYGKSTLAAEWLSALTSGYSPTGREEDVRVAWLSLDEADDEAERFWLYFLAALRQVEAGFCAELFAALEAGQVPPADVLVTTLTNEMQSWGKLHILVLDDLQAIQNPVISNALSSLLAHSPRMFHLVFLTREDPFLPLARLRARGQLTEIRAADLRFSDAESALFLIQRLGLELSAGDLADLTERTEGWVAGLQLAGLSLKGRDNPSALIAALSGSNRFILGYLTEEVLKCQPAEVQEFLLQTSILSRLTSGLCDAVTGRTDSVTLLESLLATNLFIIPLDDEGRWYRYHHLFADLLRGQLRRQAPGRLTDLHQRASRWYEAESIADEAIEHALTAGDFARVAGLLEHFGWQLLNQGFVRKMEVWMQSVPAEWRSHSPRSSLGFAWMQLLRGNFPQAWQSLNQAQAALAQHPAAQISAECLALQANLLQTQGAVDAALQAAHHSLELVAPDNFRVQALGQLGMGGGYRQAGDFDRAVAALQNAMRASRNSGELVTEMLAVSHLTLMSLQFGRLRFAVETATRSVEWMEQNHAAPPPIVGSVLGSLGRIYYEWNELDRACEMLERGIRLATFTGHSASLIYGKVSLSQIFQARGNLDAAERSLAEAAELLHQGAPGWVRPDLLARQVCLLLAQGNPSAAEALLHQSGLMPSAEVTHQTDALHLAWLRLLIHQQHPAALELAERIISSAEASQRKGTLIQALALGAQIPLSPRDGVGVRGIWLIRALELGEPEGYLRVFLDESQGLQNEEFKRINFPAVQRAYLEKVLMAANVPATPTFQPSTFNIPLTARELEILRLLAEGLSYAEIAGRLVVSVNTVRYHVKGLYGKLGVEKMVQAVGKGRELGLL